MSSSYHSYPKGTFQQLLQTGKYKSAGSAQTTPQQSFYSVIGHNAKTGRELTLGDVERRSGLYVLGKPGMGKTTLLVNLALQDIAHGHGVFFLDPHADAIADILRRLPVERKDDVILLDPEDESRSFCINLLACKDIASLKERTNTYTRAYNIFHTLWAKEWGPWLEMIISNTLYTFIENPGYTLADVPLFLRERDTSFRERLVQNIRYNKEPADFWREEFGNLLNERQQREQVLPALTRVRQLLTHTYVKHVIGYPNTTIDFQQVMAERKIVLVSLSANLAENIKRFLGTILVSELLKAARDRVTLPESKRHQFCVFVDEFQNFATPDFATFITEARKFSIATTIAHQERYGQLDVDRRILGATLATVHKVIYQPTVTDTEAVAKELADRPEPAWVEELEPAWVEELEEQWEERKVDEIEDGVEPILALTDKPFDHLIRGHSNAQVSQLSGTLRELANAIEMAQAETEQADIWTQKVSSERVFRHRPDGKDGIEYVATREQLLHGKQLIETLIADVQHGTVEYGSYIMVDRLAEIAEALRAFIGLAQGAVWEKESEVIDLSYDTYSRAGKQTIPRSKSASRAGWGDVSLDPGTERSLPNITEVVVSEALAVYQGNGDSSVPAVHKSSLNNVKMVRMLAYVLENVGEQVVWCKCGDENNYEYKNIHIEAPQSLDDVLNLPAELPKEKRREITAERRTMLRNFKMIAAAEGRRLTDFLSKLAGLCLASSSPEQHIYVQSGQHQPRIHKQIHYTPRLTLPHPQPSTAEKVAQKELDLLGLAPYTAAYKLLPSGGNPPVKGVLSTFELPKPYPYYIVHGLRRDIVAAPHQHYSKLRIEIEEALKSPEDDGADGKSAGNQPSPVSEEREQKRTRRDRKGEV